MPRLPKRYGLIMDNTNPQWPLSDSLPSLSRSSSVYSTNSDGDGPSTPEEPEVLPGFHFSTTDESVDPVEFHRIAATLLGGGIRKRSSVGSKASQSERRNDMHCNMGRDPNGRHCCSCGKTYTTPFRLSHHIQQCTGVCFYACPKCDKLYQSRENRDHHIDARHSKEACPGCGAMFLAGHLQKHLTMDPGGCRNTIPHLPLLPHSSSMLDELSAPKNPRYWIDEGQVSGESLWESAGCDADKDVSATMDFVKQLLNPMALPRSEQPCELCGELCSTDSEELTQHLGEHSVDFSEKRHQCDDCQIFFADERGLEKHLLSVNIVQHCGLTFSHSEAPCIGHHAPVSPQGHINPDHYSMRTHLSAWEQAQYRAHRANIARLLATRLNKTISTRRMSVQDCRKTYSALLPHVNKVTSDALPPISESIEEVVEERDNDEVEAEFCRIMSDFFPGKDQIPTIKAPSLTMLPLLPLVHKRSESALPKLQSTKSANNRKGFHDVVLRRVSGNKNTRNATNHHYDHNQNVNQYKHKKSRTLGSLAPLMVNTKHKESGVLGGASLFSALRARESSVSTHSSLSTSSRARDSQSSTRPSSVGTDILLTVPYDSVVTPPA